VLVDLGAGTGIVTTHWRRAGRLVVGMDASLGMLGKAASRLPGTAVAGDATRLPLRSGSVDVVTAIWLLHLLPDAAPVIAEAARVLGRNGVLLTTVDKNEATFAVPSDIAVATAPFREAARRADRYDTVVALAREHGMVPVGQATFPGHHQGRSPRDWHHAIKAGAIPWARTAPATAITELCRTLATLPGPDTPRPDPIYRVIALART
jgi:SAM-dependent methyltransferase